MITDWQVETDGERILLGLAVQSAVLDIQTDRRLLNTCVTLLETSHKGLVDQQMGSFGPYPIRLNVHTDETVSIFVDGPGFNTSRCQSSAIWVSKDSLHQTIVDALRAI